MTDLQWTKSRSGMHVSASAGNYRIHASGKGIICAYQFSPFIPLGNRCESVKIAQKICQQHHDEIEQP